MLFVYNAVCANPGLTYRTVNSQFASHILLVSLQNEDLSSFALLYEHIGQFFRAIAVDQYGCRIVEYLFKQVNLNNHQFLEPLLKLLELQL